MTLVTVLLPVRNGAKHLREAILSVVNQSHQNIELILIDDGSSDQTPQIIEEFIQKDNRVSVTTTDGVGISAALNLGLDRARGVYTARMDSDDISDVNRIKIQIDEIEKNDLHFIGTQGRSFGTLNQPIRKPVDPSEIRGTLLLVPPIIHPSVLGRTEAFKALGYNVEITFGQDYELWTRAVMSDYRLGNCKQTLLNYRTHSKQISEINKTERLLFTRSAQRSYWVYFFGPSVNIIPAFDFLFEGADFGEKEQESLCACLRVCSPVVVSLLLPYVIRTLVRKSASASVARKRFHLIVHEASLKIPIKEAIRMSRFAGVLHLAAHIKSRLGH